MSHQGIMDSSFINQQHLPSFFKNPINFFQASYQGLLIRKVLNNTG